MPIDKGMKVIEVANGVFWPCGLKMFAWLNGAQTNAGRAEHRRRYNAAIASLRAKGLTLDEARKELVR